MEQFRIEVAIDGKGRFYEINPLGNARYQISQIQTCPIFSHSGNFIITG
jgi:hypothetical protein